MAGAESSPLLASRTDLVDAMARGGKPRAEWRVGTEHEKHIFRRAPLRPLLPASSRCAPWSLR